MDSYKVFQSVCLALVLSCARAGDENVLCPLEKGHPAFRLASRTNKGEGRAEVLCDGAWGTISNENWNHDLTTIFCSELGFNTGKQVTNVTIEGQGQVVEMQCTGDEVSMRECKFTKLEPDEEYTYVDPVIGNIPLQAWNHTNDVMLDCFQLDPADLSKSSVQQLKGQSNMGQDSPDAVMIKKTSPSNITLLVVVDGIEFVLLFVAVVVTSLIVYRKATRKMNAALKEKRSPESQSMLGLSQVTVQQPTAPPQEEKPGRSGGQAEQHNPFYGMAEKY